MEESKLLKRCCCCGLLQDYSCYTKNRTQADGLNRACKVCQNTKYRKKTVAHKWYIANKDLIQDKHKEYVVHNIETIKKYHKNYRKDSYWMNLKKHRNLYRFFQLFADKKNAMLELDKLIKLYLEQNNAA